MLSVPSDLSQASGREYDGGAFYGRCASPRRCPATAGAGAAETRSLGMKFYTFDELTYPKLPEYGPEIRFTNRFCDPAVVGQTYADHLDEWAMCEDLGFDGAFVNEHHFTALNIQPACNLMAAAIIMRTRRMKVGVIGNVIPLRNPIRRGIRDARLSVGRPLHRGHRARRAPGIRLLQRRSLHQPFAPARGLRDHPEVPDRGAVRLRGQVLEGDQRLHLAQAGAAPAAVLDAGRLAREHRVRRRASHLQRAGLRPHAAVPGELRSLPQGGAGEVRLEGGL